MSTQVGEAPVGMDRCDPSRLEVIERVFEKIGEVSSLPSVAMEIMEMASDTDTDVEDLITVIRSDPALAMRIMRTVNSSYHGIRQTVSDLKQAVNLLGFQEIRNIALSAFVAPLFRETAGYGTYSREGLWNHMVGTGMIAHFIAETTEATSPQEAYLAGLLHDIGLVLIDQYLHAAFRRIVDSHTAETSLSEMEQKVVGFDHAALGAHVAGKWKLPDHLIDAIGHHHDFSRYTGENREMVLIVSLGDWLCNLKGIPPLGISTRQLPPAELFGQLGLGREQTALVVAQLDSVLDKANIMARCQIR